MGRRDWEQGWWAGGCGERRLPSHSNSTTRNWYRSLSDAVPPASNLDPLEGNFIILRSLWLSTTLSGTLCARTLHHRPLQLGVYLHGQLKKTVYRVPAKQTNSAQASKQQQNSTAHSYTKRQHIKTEMYFSGKRQKRERKIVTGF